LSVGLYLATSTQFHTRLLTRPNVLKKSPRTWRVTLYCQSTLRPVAIVPRGGTCYVKA
jgi:hypothetical protein